jgi:phosphoribosyl 1,2-cyclic phosphodiesterase
MRYGGNTSCVEVRLESGHVLVLDAGTGMRPLGVLMQDDLPNEIHVLLTHLHLDHLQGLGFFRPLYIPGHEIHVWGPTSPVQDLATRIAMYLSPPLFPVHLDDVPCNISFHNAPEEPVSIGSGTIRAAKVTHQGPTVGYRIEEGGRALVYVPDHDAQYRDHEYGAHVGWGHSGIADTIEFACRSEVDELLLFHHDPYHSDEDLEELLKEARAHWPHAEDKVQLAYEGMTFELK